MRASHGFGAAAYTTTLAVATSMEGRAFMNAHFEDLHRQALWRKSSGKMVQENSENRGGGENRIDSNRPSKQLFS